MNRLLLILVALLCIPAFTEPIQACQCRGHSLQMRVGPRLSERRVAGTVVWKSGRPVEGAYIAVYLGDEYVRYVSIKDGRFNFILYGDYEYSIEARDYIDEIEGRSQRIKIPQADSTGLELVIQRIRQ